LKVIAPKHYAEKGISSAKPDPSAAPDLIRALTHERILTARKP
jgi:hypothetical protein